MKAALITAVGMNAKVYSKMACVHVQVHLLQHVALILSELSMAELTHL